jgi:RNA polymerase sigma-70 factor (ECF subfamily)
MILNPEAYLFTVATHLLNEHAAIERRRGQSVNVEDARHEPEFVDPPRMDQDLDLADRVRRLDTVLKQLSPKCQAVVVMAYQEDMSYRQIAAELGISTNMVKKYVVHALAHCRSRMTGAD